MDERVAKGYGIVTEILAIMNEIPLGIYRMDTGLKLQQAMLINGAMFNNESWHNVTKDDIKAHEKVNESLIRPCQDSS